MRNTLKISAAAILVSVTLAACGSSSSDDSKSSSDTKAETSSTTMAAASETIVDVASANADFSTLVSAVKKAGLVETLSGDGPFTVFAPTNEAFAKIPKDQLDAILADQEKLKSILTYHVLPAEVVSMSLQPEQSVATVEGQNVDIKVTDGKATINGCNIVKADIEASNGVIHVIDCVLVPPAS